MKIETFPFSSLVPMVTSQLSLIRWGKALRTVVIGDITIRVSRRLKMRRVEVIMWRINMRGIILLESLNNIIWPNRISMIVLMLILMASISNLMSLILIPLPFSSPFQSTPPNPPQALRSSAKKFHLPKRTKKCPSSPSNSKNYAPTSSSKSSKSPLSPSDPKIFLFPNHFLLIFTVLCLIFIQ